MNKLSKYRLLFDEECAICSLYSKGLVSSGMLEDSGRVAYQQVNSGSCPEVDFNRARNEIALLNTETGEVYYGIDSILIVVLHSFPRMQSFFSLKPVQWLLQKLYSFIAFNRKVMVPGKGTTDTCIPDLNLKYRWLYIAFTLLLSSLILCWYLGFLTGIISRIEFFCVFSIGVGQIVFQSLLICFIARGKILQYIGNMMTVSFAGSLLLLLFGFIGEMLDIDNSMFYAGCFLLTVALMLLEHVRRMKLIDIHWFASVGYSVYGALVLLFLSS